MYAMLRNHWRAVVTIIGLAAAAIFGWLLQPKEPKLLVHSSYQPMAVSYEAYHPECWPRNLAALPRRKRERQTTFCADGEEQHRQAAGSLVEARRQADAANAGVILAAQQTRIAVWGFVIGLLTLFAAGAAAWYAKQAAESAKKNLEHDKDVAGIQLRPNVHIETVDVTGENTEFPKVTFGIRNSGTVPARELRVTGGWGFREGDVPDRLNLSQCRVPKQITYGTALIIEVPASDGQVAIREGKLYCQFEVSWENEIGNSRRIGEIHRFDGKDFRFLTDT